MPIFERLYLCTSWNFIPANFSQVRGVTCLSWECQDFQKQLEHIQRCPKISKGIPKISKNVSNICGASPNMRFTKNRAVASTFPLITIWLVVVVNFTSSNSAISLAKSSSNYPKPVQKVKFRRAEMWNSTCKMVKLKMIDRYRQTKLRTKTI